MGAKRPSVPSGGTVSSQELFHGFTRIYTEPLSLIYMFFFPKRHSSCVTQKTNLSLSTSINLISQLPEYKWGWFELQITYKPTQNWLNNDGNL